MSVNVTDQAVVLLKALLDSVEHEPGQVFRLAAGQDSIGILLDNEQEGDHVVQHEDESVLVIEPALNEFLTDATIDIQETPEGPRLAISGVQG